MIKLRLQKRVRLTYKTIATGNVNRLSGKSIDAFQARNRIKLQNKGKYRVQYYNQKQKRWILTSSTTVR